MIEKPIDKIAKSDIDALVDNEVQEGRTIEFKKTLPGNSDDDRKEFLADVSSFANAGGGDLIFGIRAEDGAAKEGLGCNCSFDSEVLRLENMLLDGIDPRILGFRTIPLTGFPQGPVILMRIPKSWTGPHMVTYKNLSRFYTRDSAGKHQMDVAEVRASVLGSELLPEKIRQFRFDRLGKIIAEQAPLRLGSGGKMVLHFVPIESFSRNLQLGLPSIQAANPKPMGSTGWSDRINLDGLVSHDGGSVASTCNSYCQVFRTGQIEAVSTYVIWEREGVRYIGDTQYEEGAVDGLVNYAGVLRALGISGPLCIMLSMVGVRGAILSVDAFHFSHPPVPIDRDVLPLPEVIVEDGRYIRDAESAAKALRPTFDFLWNACGYERSFNFDPKGNWRPNG